MKAMMILDFTHPERLFELQLAEFVLDFGDCPTPRVGEELFIEDAHCVVTKIVTGFYRYEKLSSDMLPPARFTLIYLKS